MSGAYMCRSGGFQTVQDRPRPAHSNVPAAHPHTPPWSYASPKDFHKKEIVIKPFRFIPSVGTHRIVGNFSATISAPKFAQVLQTNGNAVGDGGFLKLISENTF